MAFNKSLASTGVLILNSGYEPLKVVSWQKALILWFQDKVDILEYHAVHVRSATKSFRLPSVIRLRKYINPRFETEVRLTRQNLFIRDKSQCQYCGQHFSMKKLTVDHVQPLSRGGRHKWENVVAACSPCNNKKGNKTPQEARMPLKINPYRPDWLPQKFSSSDDDLPTCWLQYIKHLVASG